MAAVVVVEDNSKPQQKYERSLTTFHSDLRPNLRVG
jgi:hypothetical protein